MSKKSLAVFLSRLQKFEKPSARLEQYPTDSEVAAEVLWFAHQNGDIEGKVIADLGCGTGILGIGAMQFSPQKVYFVDIDSRVLKKLDNNLKLFDLEGYEVVNESVEKFNTHVDVVLQNPPFGVQTRHADRKFLEQAFSIADVIYTFHKDSTKDFVQKMAKENGFGVTQYFRFDFPLKQTQHFHTRKIRRIEVGCWRLEKQTFI